MSMQDRAYAAAIFIIIGICCIGAYVAISGFMNANPDGLSLAFISATQTPTLGVTVEIPTETAGPPTNTPLPPTKTPIGFKPTDVPEATRGPTLDFIPTIVTPEFTPTPPPSATPTGCGAIFCPRFAPPDARAPTGNPCPDNYIWGFVFDQIGKGLGGMKVALRELNGAADKVTTKAPPDPEGRFDFPANGGTWTVQVVDRQENPISPPIQIQAHVPWGGSGNCPTRVDFIQQ